MKNSGIKTIKLIIALLSTAVVSILVSVSGVEAVAQFSTKTSSLSSSHSTYDAVIKVGQSYQANTKLGSGLIYESTNFTMNGVTTNSKSGLYVAKTPGILTVQFVYHDANSSSNSPALRNLTVQVLPESANSAYDAVIKVGQSYQANTKLGPGLIYESTNFTMNGVTTNSKSGLYVAKRPGILTVQFVYHDSNSSSNSPALRNLTVQILPESTSSATPVYRLYNPNSGEHFYTHSVYEKDGLVKKGWNYEGIAWQAPVIDTSVPVYRLYNPNSGLHFYTVGSYERSYLISQGWHDEGIGWYSNSDPAHGQAIYRLYNPNSGEHFYTDGTFERDDLVAKGWSNEKLAWYGLE